jgi:hypothetical protein
MKKDKTTMQDELLPEYDLKKLRLRKVGPGRKYFAGKSVNQLNSDVIKESADTSSVKKDCDFSM